jgi:hypothetical protein
LWSANSLSRIGESRLPRLETPRRLFNEVRLSSPGLIRAWHEYDKHTYSLPFTGALFDVFNVIYHDKLHAAGLVGGRRPLLSGSLRARLESTQEEFSQRFVRERAGFHRAALEARDDFARLLAQAWSATSPPGFSYRRAAGNVLAVGRAMHGSRYDDAIRALFAWRGITI